MYMYESANRDAHVYACKHACQQPATIKRIGQLQLGPNHGEHVSTMVLHEMVLCM